MIVRQLPRVVVVGAGCAGLSTALRMARQAGGRARVELADGHAEHQLITRLHEVAARASCPGRRGRATRRVAGRHWHTLAPGVG